MPKKHLVMDTLNDFIRVHENALDSDTCDFLVRLFIQKKSKTERVECEGKPNFTQMNLTQNRDMSPKINEVHTNLIRNVFKYRDEYYRYTYKEIFPEQHAFEQFRIKGYQPGGVDRFDAHVDVKDYESSRRFLAFMWYLNDVESGGRTIFNDIEITPKKGSLLVFPPLWMFPHIGEPPKSNPKYVLTTYLHYQ